MKRSTSILLVLLLYQISTSRCSTKPCIEDKCPSPTRTDQPQEDDFTKTSTSNNQKRRDVPEAAQPRDRVRNNTTSNEDVSAPLPQKSSGFNQTPTVIYEDLTASPTRATADPEHDGFKTNTTFYSYRQKENDAAATAQEQSSPTDQHREKTNAPSFKENASGQPQDGDLRISRERSDDFVRTSPASFSFWSKEKRASPNLRKIDAIRRLTLAKDPEPQKLLASANFTGTPRIALVNREQLYNKKTDKMRLLYASTHNDQEVSYIYPGHECNFERTCVWKWKTDVSDGFVIEESEKSKVGPKLDAGNNTSGHYLLLKMKPSVSELNVTSSLFGPSGDTCRIQVWTYQDGLSGGLVRIVVETVNHTQWMINEILGDDSKKWVRHEHAVGKISQDFQIILEVVPPKKQPPDSFIALDNIKLLDCFPEMDRVNSCTPFQYRCSISNTCINTTKICDITKDCAYGDDEALNCDKMPYGARCNFEQDLCGWFNIDGKVLSWVRHNGSTPTNRTGPNVDHTYGNKTGKYMFVNMGKERDASFASSATFQSVVFNPPPRVHGNVSSRYYNSCNIRFFLHQAGSHKAGIMLLVTELRPKENVTKDILWSFNDYGDQWLKRVVILPNITHKYYLHFDAKRGIRFMGDIAIDDVSMAPECFGINIPVNELNGYSYWNPGFDKPFTSHTHQDFVNETYYEVTTCGAKGRYGPTKENCSVAYNNTNVRVKVMHTPGLNGVQKWVAPVKNFYTFILTGASGGKGSGGMGSSRGAMVRTVVKLEQGQEIYMLVGQEGTSACVKILGHRGNSSCKSLRNDDSRNLTGVRGVLKMDVTDGGGGGGGGTFVFMFNRTRQPVPLAIAAGGGGLGLGRFYDTGYQHGQAINMSKPGVTGQMYGPKSAGSGGGWEMFHGQVAYGHDVLMGQPLVQGATGGQACYMSTDGRGDGGFGAGGGGCTGGGGGGGFSGGSVITSNTSNGDGGYSYLDSTKTIPNLSEAISGYHAGDGMVLIIPAVSGCGCDHRCVALDARKSQVTCICPDTWKLDEDGKSCVPFDQPETYPYWIVIPLFVMVGILMIGFGFVCFLLYNRYQESAVGFLRRKMLSGPDLQLNRLRVASDNMITEYNPNYEFGGVVYTIKDLKDIPRDQLQLQKALGQGAFGEVYQGFYRQRSGDTVEMPVAVKTLPAMSASDAEMDFLMEALIMSKFNHPNIVHFIGVCFDKHPRFIVLELLAGGDLKNFLRESRPKPDKYNPLTMKDLVLIAIDVAKGCRYMEQNRFIHRDIAARNCLLTTQGPGRVVKIADFGMARDIYRSDYYRKGGRAMLPIKWMPPEAFLDGIFTSKTDVWSFGVLIWEIMSMGYMPYTGCTNRQVMQLVASGGRLEPPTNCPGPIYGIMTQCWHPEPEQRPTFTTILERLGYCLQDPEVLKTPLPIFSKTSSQEQDATVMRPTGNDVNCLQISKAADYLIPNNIVSENVIGSTTSVDRLIPENSDSWETSFVAPHSKSTQPLLLDAEQTNEDAPTNASSEKRLSVDQSHTEPSNQKTSPISLQSSILTSTKPKSETSLRAGVSLDAGALAKQTASPVQKKSYANVNASDEKLTGNGVIPNGQCIVPNQNNYLNTATGNSNLLNDVTC